MCGSMADSQSAMDEIRRGKKKIEDRNRMWANAQRDGRPAEHRWRPLFNAAKLWRADGDFLENFLHPAFSASRVQHVSDLHPKFALGHTMCGSMVDIQSPTVEIIIIIIIIIIL